MEVIRKFLPGKSKSFCEIAWQNGHLSEICLEIDFFISIHDTQISNQIDAAGHNDDNDAA